MAFITLSPLDCFFFSKVTTSSLLSFSSNRSFSMTLVIHVAFLCTFSSSAITFWRFSYHLLGTKTAHNIQGVGIPSIYSGIIIFSGLFSILFLIIPKIRPTGWILAEWWGMTSLYKSHVDSLPASPVRGFNSTGYKISGETTEMMSLLMSAFLPLNISLFEIVMGMVVSFTKTLRLMQINRIGNMI